MLGTLEATLLVSKGLLMKSEPIASRQAGRDAQAKKLNWLRAGVLGANDGIVSTAGIVMGVAGASTEAGPILIAGVAAMVAGSISMAGGEYTSVSAQRDSEIATLAREAQELKDNPEQQLMELRDFYAKRGLSKDLAGKVAAELTSIDALKAHAEAELGLSTGSHASPGAAAISSFISFFLGSLLPLIAITGPWVDYRELATVVSVVVALAITGFAGAKIGQAKPLKPIIRNVFVSVLTMSISYAIGAILGVTVL